MWKEREKEYCGWIVNGYSRVRVTGFLSESTPVGGKRGKEGRVGLPDSKPTPRLHTLAGDLRQTGRDYGEKHTPTNRRPV